MTIDMMIWRLGPALARPPLGPDAGVAAMGAAETPGGGLSEPHCAVAGPTAHLT